MFRINFKIDRSEKSGNGFLPVQHHSNMLASVAEPGFFCLEPVSTFLIWTEYRS